MTTRTRESGPGKEKRGTSPSNLPNTQSKRSQNPSKPNSPARTHDSPAPEKPVPNYLKPTLSSGTDFVSKQQGKKPLSSTDSTNKATLTRRRSFDKPPSSSQMQKPRVSPNPTLRSSSFSGKSTTASSQRGVLDKNSKQHSLYARPVNTSKKGGVYVKKQEAAKEQVITGPTDKVDNLDLSNVPEPETLSKDQESGTDEAAGEKLVEIGNINEKGSEDLLKEDQEPRSIEQSEGESEKDDKDATILTVNTPTDTEHEDSSKIATVNSPTDIKHEDSSKITTVNSPTNIKNEDSSKITTVNSPTDMKHEDSKIETVNSPTEIEHEEDSKIATVESPTVSPGVKTDEPAIESHTEEISSKQEELEEHSIDSSNNINSTDESVAGNPNVEIEEKKQQEEDEAEALNEKEAEGSVIEAHESEQTEEVHEAVVEKKHKEAEAGGTEAHESKKTEEVEEAAVEEKQKAAEASGTEAHESKQTEVQEAVVEENQKEASGTEAHEPKQTEEAQEAVVQEKQKEAEASGTEAHESKQTEVQEVVVQQKQKAAEKPGPKVQVMAHGKKEIAVSNNVIEETASKLREQRKNKVKALAGAFESVMSSQENK